MAGIKLTKNELKKQKDALRRYLRYLPTLVLKKQQLQMVIRQVEALQAQKERERADLRGALDLWIGVFGDAVDLAPILRIGSVTVEEGNIAGVDIPVFRSAQIVTEDYDLFLVPLWVDKALYVMKTLLLLDLEIGILRRQQELLAEELRITSQRVNLFEKVKIPEAKENIRMIRIYLGDQQTAAVVRGKMAKNKVTRAS